MFLNPNISYDELEQKVDQIQLKLKALKEFQVIAYLGSSPVEYWILFLVCKRLNLILFMPNQRQSSTYQAKNLGFLKPVCFAYDNLKLEFHLGKTYKSSGVVVQTSGSSGNPKFCLISFFALDKSAEAVANYFNLLESESWQLNLPCYHVGGIGILNRAYLRKAKVDLSKSLTGDPKTLISIVPSFLKDLEQLCYYKTILVGASGVSVELSKKISKKYSNVYFSYGLTEFSSTVAIGKISNQLKLLDLNQAKVEDEILYLKGGNKFTEYLGIENYNSEYFKTSDRAILENNNLEILGRIDRIINSGGEKISPEIIENLICENFNEKVVVLKVVSKEWGERPVLIYENELEVNKAKELIEENLGRIFIPDSFIKLNIPLTSIGKVNYKELQDIINKS